jgi:hypothetical protein
MFLALVDGLMIASQTETDAMGGGGALFQLFLK